MIYKLVKKIITRLQIGLVLALSAAKWRLVSNNSKIVNANVPDLRENIPLRAILLWAEKCNFSNNDINLVRWASQGYLGSVVLIVNCDCKKYSIQHLPTLFKEYPILIRRNVGYDWGGYRDFISYFDMTMRPYITLLNNSVIPLGPFSLFLEKQEELAMRVNGIAGAVESANPIYHLQSFSLTFSNFALLTPLTDWLKSTKNISSKWAMVYFREIRMAQIATRYDLPMIGVITNRSLREFAKENLQILENHKDSNIYQQIQSRIYSGSLNPTHHLWRFLIELGFPFIKKELLFSNPCNMPDIYLASKYIEGTLDDK
jgi:hypothetical protein